jgi:prefoldin alpha subunit
MSDEEKIQSLVVELRILESYLNEVNTRQATLVKSMIECRAAIDALRGLSENSDSELLVPIGGGLFINSRAPPPEKLIVSIGANIALEKTRTEASNFINNKIKDIEKNISETEFQKNNLKNRINSTNNIIRNFIEKQKKG